MARIWPLALLVVTAACDGSIGVRGRVLDEAGDPVRGGAVELDRPGDLHIETETDEDGCFDLWTMVAPGQRDYFLTVSSAGYEPFEGTVRSTGEYAVVVRLSAASSTGDAFSLDGDGLPAELATCARENGDASVGESGSSPTAGERLPSSGNYPATRGFAGDPAEVDLASQPDARAFRTGWRCRNDLEVSCGQGACEAETGDAFTPMSVRADDTGAMSVCAYSGCWRGTGEVFEIGGFLIFAGRDLEFSTSADSRFGRADVVLAIDRADGVGTLKVSEFAQPVLCDSVAGGSR